MQRKRLMIALGVGVWLTAAPGSAAASGTSPATTQVTVVTVTLGKPSEHGLKLSRFSDLPAGTITFKVKNAGSVAHDFKVCARRVIGSAKNACVGEKTGVLRPGRSEVLTVVLTRKGKYAYLSTLPGDAAAGMKGLIGVGVKLATPVSPAQPAPSTTPTPPTPPPGGLSTASCPRPQATTVDVNLFEYAIALSTNTVPCGPVTFNVRNTGKLGFDFAIRGSVNREGRVLNPGESAPMTVSLPPGSYAYLCTTCVDTWDMEGVLSVSG